MSALEVIDNLCPEGIPLDVLSYRRSLDVTFGLVEFFNKSNEQVYAVEKSIPGLEIEPDESLSAPPQQAIEVADAETVKIRFSVSGSYESLSPHRVSGIDARDAARALAQICISEGIYKSVSEKIITNVITGKWLLIKDMDTESINISYGYDESYDNNLKYSGMDGCSVMEGWLTRNDKSVLELPHAIYVSAVMPAQLFMRSQLYVFLSKNNSVNNNHHCMISNKSLKRGLMSGMQRYKSYNPLFWFDIESLKENFNTNVAERVIASLVGGGVFGSDNN